MRSIRPTFAGSYLAGPKLGAFTSYAAACMPGLPLFRRSASSPNALKQTGWEADRLTDDTWRPAVRHRLHSVTWQSVTDDVRPFPDLSADVAS